MPEKINIPLFVLDFFIILPITLLRLVIIWLYGSRYNIPNFKIFDIVMHADKKKFNMGQKQVRTMKDNLKDEVRDLVKDSDDEIVKRRNTKRSSKSTNLEDLMVTENGLSKYDRTSVDNDLDKLTNLVSTLMDKNQKIEEYDDELEMLEYSNSEAKEQRVVLTSSNDYDNDLNSLLMSQKERSDTFNCSLSETDKRPKNDILD